MYIPVGKDDISIFSHSIYPSLNIILYIFDAPDLCHYNICVRRFIVFPQGVCFMAIKQIDLMQFHDIT